MTMETRQRPITVNCIGAGRWGPNLVRAFSSLPDVRVRQVCDLDPHRLALLSDRIAGVRTTTLSAEVIADDSADAVVIATPVRTHYALAKQALRAHKHVLVEKPLCRGVGECQELTALAEERGLVLAVGHVFLFNAGIRKVKECIQSGELGRIYYLHAVRTNLGPVREDVNALWDLAAHDLSIFDYWLDDAPESVRVCGRRYVSRDLEDVVTADFIYPGGVLASAYASWLNPRKVREITVVGEKKMVVWNDTDLTEPVRLYNRRVDLDPPGEYTDSFASFRATIRDGDVLVPHVTLTEPLIAQCAHFADCIRTGRQPLNNAYAAMDVVRSLAATDVSLRDHGREVKIGNRVARDLSRLRHRIDWPEVAVR